MPDRININFALTFGDIRQRIGDNPPTTLDDPARDRPGVFALPNTHRPNPNFVGKQAVQCVLCSLQLGDTLVLHGMPGVGKTQHAVQHAYENQHRFKDIFWASADSDSSFVSSLAACAHKLSSEINHSGSSRIVGSFQQWLSANSRWLLIIDNVDSPETANCLSG
jgi:hypothetical protein